MPPKIGATAAASELITPVAAKYAVACPLGASLSPILLDANVTPAVEMPKKMWMAIKSGIVSACFPGSVVNVHARIQMMNNGPLTPKTDLLLNLSEKAPQVCKNIRFAIWLNTIKRMINDMSSSSLFNM